MCRLAFMFLQICSLTQKAAKIVACAMQINSVSDLPVAGVACPKTCDICPKGPSSQPGPSS